MNVLRQSIYLQAMGVDAYVSRRQLPGAAPTRRLVRLPAAPPEPPAADTPARLRESVSPARVPRIASAAVAAPAANADTDSSPGRSSPPRFSLAAVTCGGWLWLEELEGEPFSAGQLQLVQAMATAMGGLLTGAGADRESVVATRFDWPMHNNLQLDQGEDAARSSLAAFIQRRFEQSGSRGLVLLGQKSAQRVPLDLLDNPQCERIASTAAMLLDPLLKKQAWANLRRLAVPR